MCSRVDRLLPVVLRAGLRQAKSQAEFARRDRSIPDLLAFHPHVLPACRKVQHEKRRRSGFDGGYRDGSHDIVVRYELADCTLVLNVHVIPSFVIHELSVTGEEA